MPNIGQIVPIDPVHIKTVQPPTMIAVASNDPGSQKIWPQKNAHRIALQRFFQKRITAMRVPVSIIR